VIVDGHRIRRVGTGGVISTVAGGRRGGFSRDGGPARDARFGVLTDVEPLPGGGLLVLDSGREPESGPWGPIRVRRIDPKGIVRTVAGGRRHGARRDGGPAVNASFDNAVDLAVLPHGGFLIVDAGDLSAGRGHGARVRRISPRGRITTIAGNGRQSTITTRASWRDGVRATRAVLEAPTGVVPTPDGGFFIADAGGIRFVNRRGFIRTVSAGRGCPGLRGGYVSGEFDGPGAAIFNGDGRPVGCGRLNTSELALVADGGLLTRDATMRTVRLLDGPQTDIPAAAITDSRADETGVTLRFYSTITGTARLSLVRNGQTLLSQSTIVQHPGAGEIAAHHALPPGVYDARLLVRGRRGAAGSELGLTIGPLPFHTARRLMKGPADWLFPPNRDDVPYSYRPCRRFGPQRIDCKQFSPGESGNRQCDVILSVSVDGSGLPTLQGYGGTGYDCTDFQPNPTWQLNTENAWPPWNRLTLEPAPLLPPFSPQ
jgi:hypothetical protein